MLVVGRKTSKEAEDLSVVWSERAQLQLTTAPGKPESDYTNTITFGACVAYHGKHEPPSSAVQSSPHFFMDVNAGPSAADMTKLRKNHHAILATAHNLPP